MDAADMLVRRFVESRDETLLSLSSGVDFTYGQVWAGSQRLADEWTKQGVAPGGAVVLLLPNGVEFLCCYLACFIGGFVAVPVNSDLSDDDINYILKLVDPQLVLRNLPDFLDQTESQTAKEIRGHPDAVSAIFFTSGTTGRPKGVRHSLNALVGNVVVFNHAMQLESDTCLYHVLPMSYMAGFLNTFLSPLMAGGRVIIGPRFSPQAALDFWTFPSRTGAQTLWLSPSMAAALLRLTRDQEVARRGAVGFSQIFCGTAPLHSAVRTSFLETFGTPLQESYGTSELLLISAQSRADASLRSDVGSLVPGVEFEQSTNSGDQSELVIRSPFACLGYLTEEGDVSVESTSDGFVKTGDIGQVHDGRLVITGRLKDLIIRGGVNIAPITLENALSKMIAFSDVAVVGLPHPFWGESICICVETREVENTEELVKEIREFCHQHFPKSHRPDQIEVFDAFPRAITGKVQKNLLRERLST